ncbi:MAG: alanine racemase [Bacillota bacterium]|jgi:alanine racemase|nr:alanine racemase [Candidatus Fermentithermobacillaceae bacterium]
MKPPRLLRPVWAEVDLAAFRENVQTVANLIPRTTGVMPVVKANGYGIGALMAARAVRDLPSVIGFAVATPEEALELRSGGIHETILVLGPVTREASIELVKAGVSLAVASVEGMSHAVAAQKETGLPAKVHLKIETGMGRVGLQPGPQLETALEALHSGGLEFEGVFTHFSVADVDREYTVGQLRVFQDALRSIEGRGLRPRYRHAANSAGILAYPETHLDFVRPGIVIYGSFPDKSLEGRAPIKPVVSLRARVSHVKRVPAGTDIGYGRTYTTQVPTTIATVPIGYADGYPRCLSGKGWVLVRGKRYPLVGRVCMDQMMLDVGSDDVAIGDLVTLIGSDGDATITVDDVAETAGTIAHEILTGLAQRVPRLYIS